jgi:hypothetical protein
MLLRVLFTVLILAVTAAPAATIIHSFSFQNSLADSYGGSSLTSYGGTLGPSSYSFGKNQGLSLDNAFVNTDSYSIQIQFTFTELGGFRKILDFSDLQEVAGSDPGMYAYDFNLYYWAAAQSAFPVFSPGQFVELFFTRDSGGNATAYVFGAPALSFVDNGTTSRAQLTSPSTPLWFFVDDYHSLQAEAAPGEVYFIQIWDGALTPDEVAQLAVPEPAALGLLTIGLVVLAACRHRDGNRGRRRP